MQLQMIYSFNLHRQKYISIYTQPLIPSFNMGCKVLLPTFSYIISMSELVSDNMTLFITNTCIWSQAPPEL